MLKVLLHCVFAFIPEAYGTTLPAERFSRDLSIADDISQISSACSCLSSLVNVFVYAFCSPNGSLLSFPIIFVTSLGGDSQAFGLLAAHDAVLEAPPSLP